MQHRRVAEGERISVLEVERPPEEGEPAGAESRPRRDALVVNGLRVRRGTAFDLSIEHLSVRRGETLAVIGLNGAGKSTLLEALALLLKPDGGEVRVLGETASGGGTRRRLRRRLGLALQDPFLLSGAVLENVALPLRLRGIARADARSRARRWLARFGIAHLADRPSREISGGEARRTSLARALVTDPDLLLLDEPFSGLDPPTRDALLRDFQRALNLETAVVLVTHDRSEALSLAQQIAVLHEGRLLQWGAAQDVFRSPANETVAALVGLESILSGPVIASENGLCRVEVASGVTIEAAAEAPSGSRLTLCIHPEEVTLERPRPGTRSSARNLVPALIRSITPHGTGCRIELECPFPLVALVTRRSVDELGLRPDDRVTASFKASAVHVFPARTPAG
jgi:tungstate transport system ATP-binding protein